MPFIELTDVTHTYGGQAGGDGHACGRRPDDPGQGGRILGRRRALGLRQVHADEARDRVAIPAEGRSRRGRAKGRPAGQDRRHGLPEPGDAALAHRARQHHAAAGDRRAHRSQLRSQRAAYVEKAEALLATVGLKGMGAKYPWQLSGGMQQRASLCRSLIHDPKLLMLDEPFGALDAFTREELWCVIRDLHQLKKFTVVLVTHDLREAVFLGDRIFCMSARPAASSPSARSIFPVRATSRSPTRPPSPKSCMTCAG